MNEELLKAIGFFTRDTGIMDMLAVSCGRGEKRAFARDGREIGRAHV